MYPHKRKKTLVRALSQSVSQSVSQSEDTLNFLLFLAAPKLPHRPGPTPPPSPPPPKKHPCLSYAWAGVYTARIGGITPTCAPLLAALVVVVVAAAAMVFGG